MATDHEFGGLLPLREPTFFILLSLANGQRHGYAIMKEVMLLSQERIKLSTGTLYEALARLLEQELIERVDTEPPVGEGADAANAHPGRARKAYRLTPRGHRLLAAETARLQALLAAAHLRLGTESA